ncbi:Ig-like domain-containing protein [Flagellimonas marinaquae]|uniref:Ig-like domain-containing protein n=1 Tax=Flagellimonas marinaquae TaxID=254955 RepID=UPI000F8C69D7|nr:Ig-like domain-containing protein [Allomuricauda aquimarina]
MAPHKTISYVSTLLLLITLAFTSCSKDSDLFDATVESQIEEEKDKQLDENGQLIPSVSFEAMDDEFTISGNVGSSTLDVLKNDNVQDTESFQIVEVSEPTEGTLTINADNTLTYTPHPDAANKAGDNGVVSDNFTYTLQASKGGNTGNKTATVVVNTQYGDMDMGALKAFPGAKGFGQNTVGGRGGRIIHVTTLNETGPGSLVEAMHASGPRIIVFDVAGEINWTSERAITNPYCTIAGQTAPSPGITIRGGALRISASEVIVRYLRIRPGNSVENDAVRILNRKSNSVLENVIIDHVSMGWANDEIFAVGGNSSGAVNAPVRNITLQNSIIHENLDGYNYAALLGRNVHNMSVIQNYWANNGNRVPEHTYADGSSFEFVNNVLYNYNRAVTVSYGASIFDSVGNVFKPDSDYPPGQANHVYQLNRYENPNGLVSEGIVWEDDNIEIGSYNNPYGMTNGNWIENGANGRGLPNSPYTPIPSEQVVDIVLNDVGPSVLFPDAVDARLLGDWIDQNGVQGITDISAVGGFPNLVSVEHPTTYDSDNDGMADAWEIITYGNLSSKASDDNDGNGYTNIEEFVYALTLK